MSAPSTSILAVTSDVVSLAREEGVHESGHETGMSPGAHPSQELILACFAAEHRLAPGELELLKAVVDGVRGRELDASLGGASKRLAAESAFRARTGIDVYRAALLVLPALARECSGP